MKLYRKEDLDILDRVGVFQGDLSTKMTVLASYWLTDFFYFSAPAAHIFKKDLIQRLSIIDDYCLVLTAHTGVSSSAVCDLGALGPHVIYLIKPEEIR